MNKRLTFGILTVLLAFVCVSVSAATVPETGAAADTVRFADGGWYAGAVTDSLFNGYGEMHYSDGTVYAGEWKQGKWDGNGRVSFPDGDSYSGEFSEGSMHGEGCYSYADSTEYNGSFVNNRFDGFGYLKYADGTYYLGYFKDDMRHGSGILYSQSSEILRRGYFFEDEFIGNDAQLYNEITDNPEILQTGTYTQSEPEEYGTVLGYDSLEADGWGIGMDIGIGTRDMLALDFTYYDRDRFWSVDLMLNTTGSAKGKSVAGKYEEDEERPVVAWDEYGNDILTEEHITLFAASFDLGYKIGRNSYFGFGLGIGTDFVRRNCIVAGWGDTCDQMNAGTRYYRTKFDRIRFEYKAMYRYDAVMTDNVCLSLLLGYGHLEGLYFGLGFRL